MNIRCDAFLKKGFVPIIEENLSVIVDLPNLFIILLDCNAGKARQFLAVGPSKFFSEN